MVVGALTALAASTLLAAGVWVSEDGSGTSGPRAPATAGEAACKAAMRTRYRAALAGNPTPAIQPAACVGLDQSVLTRLAGEIMSEESG